MENGEIIQPSFILHNNSEDIKLVLAYLPFFKCCLISSGSDVLGFFDIHSRSTFKKVTVFDNLAFETKVAVSTDSSLLAMNIRHELVNGRAIIPGQICLYRLAKDLQDSNEAISQSSVFIEPDFARNSITNVKFFPEGSKILVTNSTSKKEAWGKIFTVSPEIWDDSVDKCDNQSHGQYRNSKTLPCDEINVFKQGYPEEDDRAERMAEAETDEEYFMLYNQMYYASSLDGGFFGLAISPDTTRILAGSNDGEIYIIDSTDYKVLQYVRAYEYYKIVSGCHYNPLVGHQEFATCDESGFFDIWDVQKLDDGTEQACSVHRLELKAGISSCTYAPDGQLIAVTSAASFKTYVISSRSVEILYTLVYKDEFIDYQTYFTTSSLFIGPLCQVASLHHDNSFCIWQLPLVYDLKTLCLLVIRTVVKYGDVNSLPLPSSLMLQLKYQYV